MDDRGAPPGSASSGSGPTRQDAHVRSRPSPPVVIAVALPLLLAVAVAAVAIGARMQGVAGSGLGGTGLGGTGSGGTGVGGDASASAPAAPETGPLALVPLDAPDASGPRCTALLAALPAALPSDGGPLPPRPLADPAPAGARAWTAAPQPAVLRCGLTRPAELAPDSTLLDVNGVQWLRLDDAVPNPEIVSYVAVDRPVYVVLTTPTSMGSGPLQAVADTVRATLPAVTVAVR
jgi:hypothetical protein